jgi:hypothetical protein
MGLFTKTPKEVIYILNALNKPLEEEFIFAEPDSLNPRDANKRINKIVNQCHPQYINSLSQLPTTQDDKMNEFTANAYKSVRQCHEDIATLVQQLSGNKELKK